MDPLELAALKFAIEAHDRQYRKYTGEPYSCHCAEVGATLKAFHHSPEVVAAGFLHDTIEDTDTTREDLVVQFGEEVAGLVVEVTDVSKPEDGNRAARKALDLMHLTNASFDGQTIKFADLISNTKNIAKHDPDFARIYLPEKEAILTTLDSGDPALRQVAWDVLNAAKIDLGMATAAATP